MRLGLDLARMKDEGYKMSIIGGLLYFRCASENYWTK